MEKKLVAGFFKRRALGGCSTSSPLLKVLADGFAQ